MSDSREGPRKNDTGFVRAGDEQPLVGSTARGLSPIIIGGVFAVLAIALFLFLNARRTGQTESVVTPSANDTVAAAPPPPLDIAPRTPPAPPPAALPPPAPVAKAPVVPAPPDDTTQRLHAPTVVVDLQAGHAASVPVSVPVSTSPAAAGAPALGANLSKASTLASPDTTGGAGLPAGISATPAGTAAIAGALAGGAAAAGSPLLTGASGGALSGNEQFAAHVSEAPPEPAVATQMTNLGTTITQGATIPAVLETAINSDLPGYTRAVISRDVLGFDGKNVLIPRGSRVIGQYRNALSLGQSRVFIIWTRIIRPDGVTVQIGSPGDDALGRGGLTGEVNTHFFSRFGGAILLSVLGAGLNAGAAAIAGTPSTEISIGSPAAAAGTAATATVPTGTDNILPTIKVKQGAQINIFVARDLDFSSVNPVK